jgi:hypothetical protein
MDREKALEELEKVNNNLTLFMKQKIALQKYIEDEDKRLKELKESNRTRAIQLQKDKTFIEEHGRERTAKEIARLMNYSERQVQRFLQKKKTTE